MNAPTTHPLLDLAAALSLLAALLYATGWSYALHFFDQFHLGLTQLKLPTQYYLMVGFRVLLEYAAWLLPILPGLAAATLVLRLRRPTWLRPALAKTSKPTVSPVLPTTP